VDLGEVALGPGREKRAYDCRVELGACAVANLGDRLFSRQRRAIGPRRGHRVEGIGHGENPGAWRNLLARSAARVTLPVPALVMKEDVWQRRPERRERTDQTGTREGVSAHLDPLPIVERAGLVENGAVEVELADVVQLAAQTKRREARVAPPEPARDHLRDRAHTSRMASRVGVPRLDRT
jgi:hypothetical protein